MALALSVGGFYFTWAYLRAWRATGSEEAALAESTRSHLAYNLVIAGLVIVALATGSPWEPGALPARLRDQSRRKGTSRPDLSIHRKLLGPRVFSGGRPTARSNGHGLWGTA